MEMTNQNNTSNVNVQDQAVRAGDDLSKLETEIYRRHRAIGVSRGQQHRENIRNSLQRLSRR